MTDPAQLHADQITYWNGPGGAQWVAQQAHTDIMLSPVADALLAAATPLPGEQVLDIGCGCGALALAVADAVGPGGHVTGLDVSAPMLAVAQHRATRSANLTWVLADATTHAFAPASFDLLISRFGVMFFGDPVAAFANLRRALRPAGRMVFACWRSFEENPWMGVPLHAAYAAGLPRQPRPGPEDPGPYAFADPERVTRILVGAGWPAPRFSKVDVTIDIAAGGGLDTAVEQAINIGAAARALRDAPDDTRPPAIAAIRSTLATHLDGPRVALPGAVWIVESGPG